MAEIDLIELADRYAVISKKYGELAIELAEKLEQFGRYRKELEFIVAEFINRGAKLDDLESVKELLEKELTKRNIPNGQTPNT